MRLRTGVVVTAVLCACVVAAPAARAQSLTAGEITGTVEDSAGVPLRDALVTVVDVATGVSRVVAASHTGRFHVSLVAPGEYQLLVEDLGYRPVRVLGVGVRSGVATTVSVALAATHPPVTKVDTMHVAPPIDPGAGVWLSPIALRLLPDETGDLAELGRLSSAATVDLGALGLPGSGAGFLLDGIPYRPARHPDLPGGQFDTGLLRTSTFDRAVLVTNGADVEWAGNSGTTLSGFSRQGTPSVQAHFYADGSGGGLTSSKYFDPGSASPSSGRGGLFLSGPIAHDSGQFVIGVDARHVETVLPAVLSGASAESLATVAQDSFAVGLQNYLAPSVATTNALTAYTGLKWQTSAASSVTLTARYATATTSNAGLGDGALPTLGASLDTRDLFLGATLASGLSTRVSQELRLSVEASGRTLGAATPPATDVLGLESPVGADPAIPGRFHRTTVRVSETLHFDAGVHRFKFGGGPAFNSYDDTYGYGTVGSFAFSDVADFTRRQGVFDQTMLVVPTAQYSVPTYGLFAQDMISAAGGFDFLIGMRYDREILPHDKVILNQAWLTATGVNNTAFAPGLNKVSPRAALTWDVAQHHTTELRAAAGVYYDDLSTGLLEEALLQSLGDTVHRGLGALGGWPSAPAAAQAPAVGTALTVLAPKIQAPRTGRATVGLRQALGGGVTAQISGTYSHGDFLPRRVDLNLLAAPTAHDQYGRPIYGTLIDQNGLLAVQPGTSRRFSGFDVVSGIEPDGYSDYWGLTVALDRQIGGGLHLLASYTYSRTNDNWLSGRGGGPAAQLSPFPGGLGGADWSDGRSDFDVPHRVVLAAEIQTHVALSPRLAVVYRYESGTPFTPGFATGVDVSGTGSTNNPAYVDANISGMTSLLSQWSCLSGQVGQFAARNSCRDPGVQSLDLRVTFDLVRIGHAPVEVVLDALNLLESDVGVRDHALYVINPAVPLTTNVATGAVTVPLLANAGFGNVLVHRSPGRELRIGLRVNY